MTLTAFLKIASHIIKDRIQIVALFYDNGRSVKYLCNRPYESIVK